MMKKQLAKLTKIELRDVWPHEALDFTKWLALEENLDALSEEIGIDIKLIGTEVSVYKFKRYEDVSLEYVGINKHKGEDVGLFSTTVSNTEYQEMPG